MVLLDTWGGDFSRVPGVMTDFLGMEAIPVHNKFLYGTRSGGNYIGADYLIAVFLCSSQVSRKKKLSLGIPDKPWAEKWKNDFAGIEESYEGVLRFFQRGFFYNEIQLSSTHPVSEAILTIRNEEKGTITEDLILEYLEERAKSYGLDSTLNADEKFEKLFSYGLKKIVK